MYPIQINPPKRRTAFAVKSNYSYYKLELREDFIRRCGYCDTPDHYSGGRRGFHIDHFAPSSKFIALKNEYNNLIYCCPICNIGKSDNWPSTDAAVSFVGDIGFVDPCASTYQNHLARDVDGRILPLTPLGAYIHRKLRLSLKRRQICWLLDRMEQQLEQLRAVMKAQNYDGDRSSWQTFCELQEEYFKYFGILKSDD
jgi:hypothetical protein